LLIVTQVPRDDKTAGVTAVEVRYGESVLWRTVVPCGSTTAETIALSDFHARQPLFKNNGD